MKSLIRVWLFATPWTVAYQDPPSLGFSRQEYWSGLPFPSPKEFKVGPNFKKPVSKVTLYSRCLKSKSIWKHTPHDYLLKRGQSKPPRGITSYSLERPASKRSSETKSHRGLREKVILPPACWDINGNRNYAKQHRGFLNSNNNN